MPSGCRFSSSRWFKTGHPLDALWIDGEGEGLGTGHPLAVILWIIGLLVPPDPFGTANPDVEARRSSSGCPLDRCEGDGLGTGHPLDHPPDAV